MLSPVRSDFTIQNGQFHINGAVTNQGHKSDGTLHNCDAWNPKGNLQADYLVRLQEFMSSVAPLFGSLAQPRAAEVENPSTT